MAATASVASKPPSFVVPAIVPRPLIVSLKVTNPFTKASTVVSDVVVGTGCRTATMLKIEVAEELKVLFSANTKGRSNVATGATMMCPISVLGVQPESAALNFSGEVIGLVQFGNQNLLSLAAAQSFGWSVDFVDLSISKSPKFAPPQRIAANQPTKLELEQLVKWRAEVDGTKWSIAQCIKHIEESLPPSVTHAAAPAKIASGGYLQFEGFGLPPAGHSLCRVCPTQHSVASIWVSIVFG